MLSEWFLKSGGGINQTVNITDQSRCCHPGRRLPLLALQYPRNHLLPQQNRGHPGPRLARQAHSCLISRAGRSRHSLQSRVSQHIRAQDSQGMDCVPRPSRHPTVPSRAGTLQGLRPEAASGWQGSYTHREGSPHTLSSLPGSLGLFWVAGVDPVEV